MKRALSVLVLAIPALGVAPALSQTAPAPQQQVQEGQLQQPASGDGNASGGASPSFRAVVEPAPAGDADRSAAGTTPAVEPSSAVGTAGAATEPSPDSTPSSSVQRIEGGGEDVAPGTPVPAGGLFLDEDAGEARDEASDAEAANTADGEPGAPPVTVIDTPIPGSPPDGTTLPAARPSR
ncbi:hypothetical protein ACUN0C_01940 [Faunimonas sp. B44]|uniref:hypothetical protein n=1 Tax=Faunimonas sp. B44 TaxID=3461493 RepID=UPI004044B31D